jgi:beta-xylosidase
MMKAIEYQNPVYQQYLADPFIVRHSGTYYAIGTGVPEQEHNVDERSSVSFRGKVFDVLESVDLVHWQGVGPALRMLPSEYGDSYWAPEILFADGRFWMFYSVGFGDRMHHLRVAVGDHPAGPYGDTGTALTNPFSCPFAIDASPFRDEDDCLYLFYARDFLEPAGESRIGTGIVVDQLVNPTRLAGQPRVVLRPRADWQRYKRDRIIYGNVYDWHTVEGPCVRKRHGRYWCLYSGGCWQDESYGLDFAVSDHVLGPYTTGNNAGGPRLLRTVPGKVVGPGHACVVNGPDNETEYLVYHAWDPASSARLMCIDRIHWTTNGPETPGPTYTIQQLCS